MRKLMTMIALAVLGAIAWGGYWYVGASALERELGRWLDGRATAGWVAQAGVLETRGFPNRFDTTFTELELSDPETGLAWRAPVFQLLQLSYRPNHVIAVWPGEQVLGLAGKEITVAGDPLRASIEVAPDPALPLRTATVEAQKAAMSSALGTTTLGSGQLSIRTTPGATDANSYDLYAHATDIAPPPAWLNELGASTLLPERIDGLRATATVLFDKRWDISAIEDARPQPRRIQIDRFNADWGPLAIAATGTLEVRADGRPRGSLEVTATNWREIVTLLEASGEIDRDHLRTLTRALEVVAALKGDPDTLDATLSFKRGMMSLGPVPIGMAPDIRLP